MGRGKLVFKGEEKAKKKKRSAKKKSGDDGSGVAAVAIGSGSSDVPFGSGSAQRHPDPHEGSPGSASAASERPVKSDESEQGPKIKAGQGTITTSTTVVSGHGTAFKTELRAGDAILARTQSGAEEMRVVKMVLSNVSIAISSAFSSDLKTPTSFNYIGKPRDERKEKAAKAQKAFQEKEEVEARAMGTYGNKGELIYREKTSTGGYRIRREQATTEMSRSDLLTYRAKKKSDRYC